jgi:hypothetical protein
MHTDNTTMGDRLPLVAILDDYANVVLELADWSTVQTRSEVTVFDRHLSEADAADAQRRCGSGFFCGNGDHGLFCYPCN